LAKAINCLNPENGDPCGKCANCIRADNEETLDVIEIDAASNNGVDEIRNLRDTVKYPPQYGNYKVYIIDEVHMLSTAAFNALLKTLEEPPAHIVFIMATTEPQKLPETILSRCQRFDFGRISLSEITGRLKEAADASGAAVSNGALMLIARAADGGMRDALSILDMCLGYSVTVDEKLVRDILGTTDDSFLFEFCSALSGCDAGKVFTLTDRLMRDGKDPAVFARDICRHVRALLIAKTSPEDLVKVMDITPEEAREYHEQAETFTLSRLMKILDLYMSLESDMRYSSTPRLALENAGVKCCLKLDGSDGQILNDRISELEKRVQELSDRIASGAAVPEKKQEKKHTGESSRTAAVPEMPKPIMKEGDTAVWNETMMRIRNADMMIWSFLNQGELISSRDGQFRWRSVRKEGEQQFILALNKPEKNEKICQCLKEVTGRDCSFIAVQHDAVPEKDDRSDDEYLATIYATFGKEPVNVVNEIK